MIRAWVGKRLREYRRDSTEAATWKPAPKYRCKDGHEFRARSAGRRCPCAGCDARIERIGGIQA